MGKTKKKDEPKKTKKKAEPKKSPVKTPAKSPKKVEIPSNQRQLDSWYITKQRTVTNKDNDNSSFTEANIASNSNVISDTIGNNDNITNQSTVTNIDTTIFTQDGNVNTSEISRDTTVNIDTNIFTQDNNVNISEIISDTIVNIDTSIFTQDNVNISEIISDTTVNNDTSVFTQGTVSTTEIEFTMDDDDTTFFAMSTDIANRSTINNQLESIQVPVDIHVDRNQSIESEDIHVDINQSSTESEENHLEPSSKPSKRKKVKMGGKHTKKNNKTMEISNKTKSNQSDLNKIELISSENVEVIPKHVRARGPKGKFIRNTQANDTNVNIVGEASGVLQNDDRVSKGRELEDR